MALNTVEKPTQGGLGSSDTSRLAEGFPATPTDFDPIAFVYDLLDGEVTENPDVGTFSMDYAEAPEIENFVPNPTPPGPGDTNPANKPPPPTTNFPPDSSGAGSLDQPLDSSAKIAEQKFDMLIFGRSS